MWFFVMIQTISLDKLVENLSAGQFGARKRESDDLTIKMGKLINSSLHQLMKQRKTSGKIYRRLDKTGSQPAVRCGLSKAHKNGTPLWPNLSLPGSIYEKFCLWFSRSYQVQILRLTRKMPEPHQTLPSWIKVSL